MPTCFECFKNRTLCNRGMCRLCKIKLNKMCEKWSHFLVLLLAFIGIILMILIKIAPMGIQTIYNIPQIQAIGRNKPDLKLLGPRQRDQHLRKELVEKFCNQSYYGSVGSVVANTNIGLSYCVLPYSGSNFWLRVFSSIQNGDKKIPSSVDFTKAITKNALSQYFKVYHPQKEADQLLIDQTTKLLFVRNPYARLWFIYIENLYLPVMWFDVGREIIAKRNNPRSKSASCGHDVTFVEFLDHVIENGKDPIKMNSIWKPVLHSCSPCLFRPDFIGKMESIDAEGRYIFQKFNLLKQLEDIQSYRSEIEIIRRLVDSYFKIYRAGSLNTCITVKSMAERIWTGLQVAGFLPLRSEKFLDSFTDQTFDINIFREHVVNIYIQGQESRHLWRHQYNRLIKHAYQEVPFRILKGLTTIYSLDFKAFNYEMFPKAFLKTIG